LELAVALRSRLNKEKIYVLDDLPPVIKAVISVMGLVANGGYKITPRLRISDPGGKPCGELMHRIVSAVYGVRLDMLVDKEIRFNHRLLPDGRYNYKLGNVWFPQIEFLDDGKPTKIDKVGNEIHIFREELQQTTIYDYRKGFWALINKYSLHYLGRDHREALYVDTSHTYLLYRVALADFLYCGLPLEPDALIAAMERFEAEYGHGLEVDHLDGDYLNCRTDNLMLMTKKQNTRKQSIQKKLRESGILQDFRLIRASDDTILIVSNRHHINEIWGIDDCLDILQDFTSP
jgi:hypothetical protein